MNNTEPVSAYFDSILAMAKALQEATVEAEQQRRIPEANIRLLAEAGLLRVFQPRQYGGSELSMAEVLPMITQTARACPATAWVMAVLQIHAWLQGLFPQKAQDEVYADDPHTLVCGVLQPKSLVQKVDGGYLLGEALWPYASGCDHASWAHLGGLLQTENAAPQAMVFQLPATDYDIVDDWHVSGLRGTGSKSLRCTGVFVPAHRAIKFAEAIDGTLAQGRSILYQSAILPMLCLNVTGPALGAAQCALDVFLAHIENRRQPFSMYKQVDSVQTQGLVGEILLLLDSAELLLEKGAALVQDYAEQQTLMPVAERSRIRAYSSAAVRQCVTAIENMLLASGGTALQESHRLQQFSRDSKAMAAHAALAHENNLELWGAVRLGKALNSHMV